MSTPLMDAIRRYADRHTARFHTPGHAAAGKSPAAKVSDWISFDVTEVPGLDSLYEAHDCIEKAEILASKVFGSALTVFSAGGCTLAVQTMLFLAAAQGRSKKILLARNAHVSVYRTCALLGLEPYYLVPDARDANRITPAVLKEAVEKCPDACACLVTSPDYYGVISDISGLARICHSAGILLLVDNAHGAHLGFFDRHPLAFGADITADSAHKTLPVLTGGAYLHIRSSVPFADRSTVKTAMSYFGSTSPSYPILASLDLAREWAETRGKPAFTQLYNTVEKMREKLSQRDFLPIPGETDPVRLVIDSGDQGTYNGDVFRKYGVEPEFCDRRYTVLLPTPFHTSGDFERMEKAFCELHRNHTACLEIGESLLPEPVLSLRDAMFAPAVEVSVNQAIGRIAAGMAVPCPPGVPLLVPGEKISYVMAERLKNSGISRVKVIK